MARWNCKNRKAKSQSHRLLKKEKYICRTLNKNKNRRRKNSKCETTNQTTKKIYQLYKLDVEIGQKELDHWL